MFDFGNRKELSNKTNKEIIAHLQSATEPVFIIGEGTGHIVGSDHIEEVEKC